MWCDIHHYHHTVQYIQYCDFSPNYLNPCVWCQNVSSCVFVSAQRRSEQWRLSAVIMSRRQARSHVSTPDLRASSRVRWAPAVHPLKARVQGYSDAHRWWMSGVGVGSWLYALTILSEVIKVHITPSVQTCDAEEDVCVLPHTGVKPVKSWYYSGASVCHVLWDVLCRL